MNLRVSYDKSGTILATAVAGTEGMADWPVGENVAELQVPVEFENVGLRDFIHLLMVDVATQKLVNRPDHP